MSDLLSLLTPQRLNNSTPTSAFRLLTADFCHLTSDVRFPTSDSHGSLPLWWQASLASHSFTKVARLHFRHLNPSTTQLLNLLNPWLNAGFGVYSLMSKAITASFRRRMPDNLTEELVAILSSRASFEFKPLFDMVLLKLRERNAASGGEEMLRLRVYEKLQGLVSQGAVDRTVDGITKRYKGVAPRMISLKAEMKVLRNEWSKKLQAKAKAAA
jgi:hypothetical protein